MTVLSALVANALLAAVWQGLLLTLSTAAILRLLPRLSASARFAVWSIVFLLSVGLHFVRPAPQHAAYHADPSWSIVLASIWVGLLVIRFIRLVRGAVQIRALARRATPLSHTVSIGSLRRPAMLCTSTEIDRPSVLGFFNPRILLPPDLYTRLSPGELEHVLLHEASHLRRGDDWTNLLQQCALVLFPLNPILLWVEWCLCRERELACDDHVILQMQTPKAYALCLASIAEHAMHRRTLSLALGAWQRRSELTARIHRILGRPPSTFRRSQAASVVALLCVGLVISAHRLSGVLQPLSFLASPTVFRSVATPPERSTPSAGRVMRGATRSLPVSFRSDAAASPRPRPAMRRMGAHRSKPPSPKVLAAKWATKQANPVLLRVSLPLNGNVRRAPAALQQAPLIVPVAAYVVRTTTGWLILEL